MESKNARVRQLVSCGSYKQALQICKDWDYDDPAHRHALRLGYECLMYPHFYKQLGYDPEEEYNKAITVLNTVYR